MLRRLLCATIGAVVLVGSSLATPLAAHAVEPYGPSEAVAPVTAVAQPMWQTNETVVALANAGGVIYAGGTFTSVRPPGAPLGSQEVSQPYLAAFSATTGALITTWQPAVTGGTVDALRVSPDGSRLYVGGDFLSITQSSTSGAKIAAFDIAQPAAPVLLSSTQFTASANGLVKTIAVTPTTVYFGGTFTKVGTVARQNIAAVSAGTGALQAFAATPAAPTAPYYKSTFVSSMTVTPTGRLAVGGMFGTMNGQTSQALAVLDGTTGAIDPTFVVPSILPTSWVTTSVVDPTSNLLYVGGRDSHTGDANRLEGVMAMDATTGVIRFGSNGHRCLGDSFALQIFKGTLFTGTHAHDCSQIGTHPESNPRFYAAVLAADAATGQQLNFYPKSDGLGKVAGSLNNVRAFTSDGTSIWVGGGWTTWNGVGQQNLVHLTAAKPSLPPTKVFPKVSASGSAAGVTISFPAAYDMDNRLLTYSIYKTGTAAPLTTFQQASAFWDQPGLTYFDSSVARGGSATYTVSITDGDTTVTSAKSAKVTVPPAATNYQAAVLSDQPRVYWRLGDAAGSAAAADSTSNNTVGNVNGSVAFGQSGALSSKPNGSAAFTGAGNLSSAVTLGPISGYSEEFWFSTTTQSGGKLVGFGAQPSGLSTNYDKHVYMSDSGQLYFGVYVGGAVTINTTSSYNDGVWHHVVATQDPSGMKLYVDSALTTSGPQTASEGYTGFFRVGGDSLSGWPGQPTNAFFSGMIGEVALYTTSLTPAQICAHYALR